MESDVGNIRALREWTRRYFYTKQDINFFMTKLNQGLKGYALMFIGPRNKKVAINPGNYEFTLNSDGWYRYLFFFERNQEITIAVQDGETITYQLDEYNDTINLSPWVIATPQMTGVCRPSGYITCSSANGGVENYFDRNESSGVQDRGGIQNRWITYEFPEPIIIYKSEIFTPVQVDGSGAPYDLAIRGSNDNVNWDELSRVTLPWNSSVTKVVCNIDDPKEYMYYQLFIYNAYRYSGGYNWTVTNEIYFYTIPQQTSNYQLATPIMTSNISENGIVTFSSSYGANYDGYRAFDNVLSTSWQASKSQASENAWIQYKFTDKPHCIKRLKIFNSGAADNAPSEFKFQASNDGVNYIDLAICTMRHNDSYYNQPFNINNPSLYTYYRLYVTETFSSAANSYPAFSGIEMYEEV